MKKAVLQPTTKRKIDKSGWVFYVCAMAVPILQFLIFYVGVNFNSILMAFQKYDTTTGTSMWAGFDNFTTAFADLMKGDRLKYLLTNSLLYFVISVAVIMPLSLMFAYYIYRKMKLSGFFKVILFLPSVISGMIFVLLFSNFADRVIPSFFELIGMQNVEGLFANVATRRGTLIFFNIWISFSSSILLYLNTMSQIPEPRIEAAQIDGASSWRTFVSIVLPSVWPTIVTFFIISMAAFASNQAYLFSFWGDNADPEMQTLGYYMYELVMKQGTTRADYNIAAAVGLCFTAIIAPLTIVVRKLLLKFGPRED